MARSSLLYTIDEVAEQLRCSTRTIRRALSAGTLSGFKRGKRWWFQRSDINAYIRHLRGSSVATRFDADMQAEIANILRDAS